MKCKYIAFDADSGESDTFESHKKALEWVIDGNMQGGIGPEFCSGNTYIAKITHVSKYTATQFKADYCEKECADCNDDEFKCGKEEWPYDSDFDSVGTPEMVTVEDVEFNDEIIHLKSLLDDAKHNMEAENGNRKDYNNFTYRGYLQGIQAAIHRLEMNSVSTSKGGE